MNASEIDFLSSREMLGLTLPVMHTKGNNWYVDFYAHDPVSGVMKRKKYMLNKCKTDQKKRMMGSLLIHNITAKLTAAWNPWVNVDKSRQFTEIPIIFSRYRDYIKAMTDKKSMKEKTSIDYLSRLKMLETFIQECKNIKYAYQIDRAFAIDFLDHLMYDREVLVTTRNNRFKRVAYFIFFTFQLQFLFVDFNLALIYSFCLGVGMDNFVKHIHFVAFIKSFIRYFLGETCLCFSNRPVILCFLCAVTHSFIV